MDSQQLSQQRSKICPRKSKKKSSTRSTLSLSPISCAPSTTIRGSESGVCGRVVPRGRMKIQFRTPVAFLDASQVGLTEFIELLNKLFEDDEFLETLTFETSIDAPNHEKASRNRSSSTRSGENCRRYFDDHPDAREQFPTILTYGPPQSISVERRSLRDAATRGAVKQFQISKIHAHKTLGVEPVFFCQRGPVRRSNGALTNVRKAASRSSQYTDQQLNRNSKEERDALAEYQSEETGRRWAREDGACRSICPRTRKINSAANDRRAFQQ